MILMFTEVETQANNCAKKSQYERISNIPYFHNLEIRFNLT